jgi:hypothetical protein
MIDIQEYKCKKEILKNLPEMIEELFDIEKKKVWDQIEVVLDRFIDDIMVVVEYPYVDKYYRDTYYNFFSKKHVSHQRDSIRVSFFYNSIHLDDFVDEEKVREIRNAFLGFITIRPTLSRIIGFSFVSPKILKEKSFVTCLCNEKVSISGVETSVYGFPFCSQDAESISCAESALLILTDYFSNKFPDYQRLLPSQINDILKSLSTERQLPSMGLTDQYIAFVLKESGFGTKIYTKKSFNDENSYKRLLSIYIESGIPVVLILENKDGDYHAVVAMGREIVEQKTVSKKDLIEHKAHFSDLFDRFLIMNDNCTPYELVDYKNPVEEDKSYEIYSFIVPLHKKLHSAAELCLQHFSEIMAELSKNKKAGKAISVIRKDCIIRYFLTTSRSYKSYVLKSKDISTEFKALFADKSMPKFIWVAEIISGNKILSQNQIINTVVILDATESGDSGNLIILFDSEQMILRGKIKSDEDYFDFEKGYSILDIKIGNFYLFNNNLKGEHTGWQS